MDTAEIDPVLVAAQERIQARRVRENISEEPHLSVVPSWLTTMITEREAERARDPAAYAAREEAYRLEEVARQRAAQLVERRTALATVGSIDAETAEILALAVDAPPVVKGHPGSIAAAAAVSRFVTEKRHRTLLLWGPTGHGKTWAAAWALATTRYAAFVSGADVRPGDEWDRKREKALRSSLLLFDELGREHASDWFTSEASVLIETRQTRGLPTIITSNTPPRLGDVGIASQPKWAGKTLHDRYGDRLLDRLYDAKHGVVIRIQGPKSIREMGER